MDLKARCNALVTVLPDELPPIPQNNKYLAIVALEEMGIDVDPTQDTKKLVDLANSMRTVHNLVRRGMMEGRSWQDIHDAASNGDKVLLEDYRDLRLRGIRQKVRETGVVMTSVDGMDGKKLYYFSTDGKEDE